MHIACSAVAHAHAKKTPVDVLYVCVLCYSFDCSFVVFLVCMFVCLFFSGAPGKISKLLKTPALLSKRTVFFLLTAVSKQESLHLRFHC